jgi:hypothetical protein
MTYLERLRYLAVVGKIDIDDGPPNGSLVEAGRLPYHQFKPFAARRGVCKVGRTEMFIINSTSIWLLQTGFGDCIVS